MITVTLRTIPRSDGTCSVVLTRDPADPRDPEIIEVLRDDQEAVRAAIGWVTRISGACGGRLVSSDTRSTLRARGRSSYTSRMELDLGPGEHLVAVLPSSR